MRRPLNISKHSGDMTYQIKSKDIPTISILEHLDQESGTELNQNQQSALLNKRKVPNSTVPFLVKPPQVNEESAILNNRIVRVGSTTSNDLDKNTLYKMKNFEVNG